MKSMKGARNHSLPTRLSILEVVAFLDGELYGSEEGFIDGVSSLCMATESQAAFLAKSFSQNQLREARDSKAGLLLVSSDIVDLQDFRVPVLRLENPALGAALLAAKFCDSFYEAGIHSSAVIDSSAQLGKDVFIGPHCIVGPGCVVGDYSVLRSGVALVSKVRLGKRCLVEANSVIGSDGFGYVWSGEAHEKMPQEGGVVLGNSVHVGACTTIDRGTFGDTLIGDGCILDNQVQVGHNCELGSFVVLCAQVGLAGSTRVGDGVVFGGKASSTGHLSIGSGTQIAGASVVTKDIPANEKIAGNPAWNMRSELKLQATLRKDL